MSSLSTHVLDTMHGCPAAGMAISLHDAAGTIVWQGVTDADGRCPRQPDLAAGRYTVRFGVADYFRGRGVALAEPPFLDVVAIEFGIGEGHYHVPLLASPFAYSTYRGS